MKLKDHFNQELDLTDEREPSLDECQELLAGDDGYLDWLEQFEKNIQYNFDAAGEYFYDEPE